MSVVVCECYGVLVLWGVSVMVCSCSCVSIVVCECCGV